MIYEQQKTGPTLPIVSQLYKALLVQFNAHHPLGIDSKDSVFSSDVDKWNHMLKRVYYMIDKEISRLQRSRVMECSDDFTHLAVHLIALFYNDTEDFTPGDITLDTTVCAKRIKLTVFNIEHFIQLLHESTNPYDIWPVLHIVSCLVYRFPKLITGEEYRTLLQIFSEYQCNNFTKTDEKVMNYLYEGFLSFFIALKHMPFPDDEMRTSVHQMWKNIVQKVIGLNQCTKSRHLLLRHLLSERPDLCQTELLLQSYTDKVVALNDDSLKTLFYLISKVQTNTETRLKLLDWFLPGMESIILTDQELTDHVCPAILFMLCSNTKPDHLECTRSELEHFFAFLQPSSIEYFYAASNFDQGLFTGHIETHSSESSTEKYKFIGTKQIIFNSSVLKRVGESFNKQASLVLSNLETEVLDVNSIQFIFNNTAFWINFCKYIQYLPSQGGLKASLIQSLPAILKNVLPKLSHLNLLSQKLNDTFFNILHSINQAHVSLTASLLPSADGGMVSTYVKAVLVNQLPSGNILETAMPVNTYPKEVKMLHFHQLSLTLSDKQLKIFRYIVLLTQYIRNENQLLEDQKLLIEKLFRINEDYQIHGFKSMHLLTSAYLIHNIATIKDIDMESFESCLQTFLELCKIWQRQSDVIEHILLPLLKLFLRKVQNKYDEFKKDLLTYLTRFYILMNRGFLGASVQIKIIECFGLLAEIDPKIEWTLISDNCLQIQNELGLETQPLILEMLAFVRSPFHSVRMAAIKYLAFIFQSSTVKRLKPMLDEDTLFTLLTNSVEKILELDDDFTESEYIDESVNRTASFLHAIACIISTCPCFTRQALHYSFSMFIKKKLHSNLFRKLLFLILKHMAISLKQVLNENIFYLLTSWYQTFQTFQSFPCEVLSLDMESFFKSNPINIVTILYLNNNLKELDHYARLMSKDTSSLLKLAMPKILALSQTSLLSYEKLTSSNIMLSKLEEIVLHMLCNVTDYKHLKMKPCVPHPCSTDMNFAQLTSQLNLLKTQLDLSVSPIEYLCDSTPSSIQRIHLQLACFIYEAHSFEYRIEAFHRYTIFLEFLKPIFNSPDELILDFLVHSIMYTLLHIVNSAECSSIILTCIDKFLHDILPQCCHIVVHLLPGLIKSLIPLTQVDDELKQKSLCIIEYLVVDHSNDLREGILALDPFPQTAEYEAISRVYNEFRGYLPRTCLHKEIGHFITAGILNPKCNITQHCRLEGLNNINYLLTHERDYLNKFNTPSLSQCEVETLEKMLNRLVVVLSELTKSPDEKIASSAVVCLGKIGPYSMNPTALAITPVNNKQEADIMLPQVIASNLILYLGDENIKVVSIASDALFNLLNTPEGCSLVDNLSSLERKLVYPMLPMNKKNISRSSLESLFDERMFKELVDDTRVWVPNTSCTHDQWISNLTSSIINSFETSKCYLKNLIELCTIKTNFAETILRYLVYFILRITSKSKGANRILSNRLRYFFSCHHKTIIDENSNKSEAQIHMNKKSVKCLLDVIHFVRINQDRPDDGLLQLDYLHVAQAALYCSAPYSAILFSHFASEPFLGENYSKDESLSTIDYICIHQPVEGSNLQEILRQAYTEINDQDSVHGCGYSHLRQMSSRISHYKNVNNWQRVLQCSDILMGMSEEPAVKEEMRRSLAQSGLYYIETQLSDGQNLDACWRLSQWDYTGTDTGSDENSFEMNHYKALKCLHEGVTVDCRESITAARKSLVNLLNLTDMECTKQVQSVLSQLRMLQEIEEFIDSKSLGVMNVIKKWEENQFIGDVEFKHIEPILSQRCILLNQVESKEPELTIPYYLKIAQKARMENYFHIAERILSSVETSRMNLTESERFKVKFEQAQLLWDMNEQEVARDSLRMIIPQLKNEASCEVIYSQALRTYGCWQASTKSDNLSSIIRKYFEPALEALTLFEVEEKLKAYDCLARYADEKHVQISDILTSVSKMQSFGVESGSVVEMKQLAIDAYERKTHRQERKYYLLMAMQYYIQSLAEGNFNDIKIFRVVSLWLENTDDTDMLNMLMKNIMSVPSYKFVKVLPQLVARISNLQNNQNMLILQVIEKCAVEHPHHTLPLILAVANSLADEMYQKKSTKDVKKLKVQNKSATMEARIEGAKYLLSKLKRTKAEDDEKPNLVDIINQQEALSLSYIIFANNFLGDQARMTTSAHTIPNTQQLMKIKNLDKICVSTLNLKLNKQGVYNEIVGVRRFDSSYTIPGGVNEPKRITCYGSDGQKYIQLLKGKDDPRQDAVMQQVFTIMNELLKTNKTSCKRNLSVKTYKVVALSQMSGIIEWCNDSLPIHNYLVGDNRTPGAHAKYNPKDLTQKQCRQHLENQKSAATHKKLAQYLLICKKFKPVFRYFFLERFKQANDWHSMQTNYTRSVATSSMIGYILGLGDRHLNNILISLKTGEVIHIDFGIAFEQGMILPTPETVPFRLTRDLEDGMGVTGTEGTFKKTCETTLSVLRDNSDTIVTILEVLLYDPLYSWTLTPQEAAKKQESAAALNYTESVPVNKIAARALFRIKQKLQGIEEGNTFSVEGQTNILIQRARDPENLCRLFPGWQPYL